MIRTPKSNRPRRPSRLRPTLDRLEGRSLMATAGGLDPAFGTAGVALEPVRVGAGTGLFDLSLAQVESDNSIVAAGPVSYGAGASYGVVRLNADGTPNTSFGVGGEADAVLPGGLVATSIPTALLVQPNGAIVVVGGANVGGTSAQSTVVARFNADGSPDATFGTNGVVVLNQANLGVNLGFNNGIYYAALQGNDLVLAGDSTVGAINPGDQQVTAVRLTANGALDPTFGTNGVANFSPGAGGTSSYSDAALGVAIEPNGQAVILADISTATTFHPELIRLNADGSRDNSLSQAGLLASGIAFEGPNSLIIQPNGDFLVYNKDGNLLQPTLARISADGVLDQTLTVSNTAARFLSGFALQPNGDIDLFALGNFTAIRVTPNLTLDPSFGRNGVAQVAVPLPPTSPGGVAPNSVQSEALAVGQDNQVVLAGSNYRNFFVGIGAQTNPATYLGFARLTAAGTAITAGDYNGDGIADPAIYLTAPGSFAVKTSGGGPGETVQLGSPGIGASIPIPGDYYATGQADLAVYLTGPGVFAVKDPSGKTPGFEYQLGSPGLGASIPVPGDFYATGQTDLAVYLVSSGTFAIKDPSGATPGMQYQLGIPGKGQSIPVPGDYDGTGQDDLAVYLAQAGVWAVKDPTQKTPGFEIQFGMPGLGNSIPVPGDYDGSGRTELAVYLPAQAVLIYRPAFGGPDVRIPFGVPGAGQTLPAPGDYDGSGRTEVAAYIPSQGRFAYRPAKGGNDVYIDYGIPGPDQSIPVTAVVLSPFPGTKPGVGSGNAIAAPGVMGQADALDFLPDAATTAAKKGAGTSAS